MEEEYIEVKRPTTSSIKSIMDELNILVYNLPNEIKNKNKNINDNSIKNFNEMFKDKEKRNEGFCILANKMNISKHLKKTKFCNIFIQEGKCDRKVCNFAHSMEEYNFPSCAFGNNCKVKNCKFKHTEELLDEYKKRIEFKVPQNIK